ncbi:Mur ligase family protein [Salinibacterium sp. SYSU T00001]|uniref:Mur ligase family protein n=1 Tax=Homoserinimonas sedimenticola TaxID=2986805 RepID=UPI00223545C2|nr:Mur ligase family protein [Salinibacterium sedimenticola]MCW4384275.1 Mur ligase family protein [Salinibacterium sedimenticola]
MPPSSVQASATPPIPALHATVVGMAGRRSTRRMLEAIAASTPELEWPRVVVLLSRGETRADGSDEVRSWSEVLSSVHPDSVVVAPSDDQQLLDAVRVSGARVVTFGTDAPADVRAHGLVARSSGTEFTVSAAGESRHVSLALLGEHLAANALAAFAAATGAGVALETAIHAVSSLGDVGEGVMRPLSRRDGTLVIDDSASASAVSVVAALKALAMFGTEGRRTVAVLGPLDAPGALSREELREAHDRIGRMIVRLGLSQAIVVGDDARHIHNAAGLEGSWNGESVLVSTASEAYDRVRDDLGPDDVVLLKLAGVPGAEDVVSALRTREATGGRVR